MSYKKKMTYYPFIFIFGFCVGSFLNAVIYRLHTGESILTGRSHCPKCGHVLAWYELIPLASFIIQRGRCRKCKQAISFQYPLLELATGLTFFLMTKSQIPMLNEIPIPNAQLFLLLYLFAIASLLIVIFVYDLKYYIIPDKIIFPAVGLAFIYRIFEFEKLNHWDLIGHWSLVIGHWQAIVLPMFAAILVSAFFAAIFFASRGRWMGFGDVKLAFFMGLFLGWPVILPAVFLAFLLGGIIGIALILVHKKTMKSQVPFGPFLVAGTLLSMFWGLDVINWYKGFLL